MLENALENWVIVIREMKQWRTWVEKSFRTFVKNSQTKKITKTDQTNAYSQMWTKIQNTYDADFELTEEIKKMLT